MFAAIGVKRDDTGGKPLKYTSKPVSLVIVPSRVAVEPEIRIRDRATIAPPLLAIGALWLLGVGIARWRLGTLPVRSCQSSRFLSPSLRIPPWHQSRSATAGFLMRSTIRRHSAHVVSQLL